RDLPREDPRVEKQLAGGSMIERGGELHDYSADKERLLKLAEDRARAPQPTHHGLQPTRPVSVDSHQLAVPDGRAKTVFVRGYYRKDGTWVRPHYRRPPRR